MKLLKSSRCGRHIPAGRQKLITMLMLLHQPVLISFGGRVHQTRSSNEGLHRIQREVYCLFQDEETDEIGEKITWQRAF
ncbi:hypothetical protein BS17DRAFT_791884 [Gyrodon lividus]|nr:hypothetical protein BS17DRAFT_791884 [Gyrodon lividus]